MPKSNLYLYILILFIIVIFLALAVFILQSRKNTTNQPSTNVNLPTPTTIEVRVTSPPTPADIHPTSTGVFEEQLPKEQQNLANQKQDLRSKTPVQETNFTITFDYNEDKFVVELVEPKAESETKFKQWLSANYPAIPLDRFILK